MRRERWPGPCDAALVAGLVCGIGFTGTVLAQDLVWDGGRHCWRPADQKSCGESWDVSSRAFRAEAPESGATGGAGTAAVGGEAGGRSAAAARQTTGTDAGDGDNIPERLGADLPPGLAPELERAQDPLQALRLLQRLASPGGLLSGQGDGQ